MHDFDVRSLLFIAEPMKMIMYTSVYTADQKYFTIWFQSETIYSTVKKIPTLTYTQTKVIVTTVII